MSYSNAIRRFALGCVAVSVSAMSLSVWGQSIAKTGFDTTTPNNSTAAAAGNTVKYVIGVTPPTGAPSSIVVSDAIPAGTQYIAGSLKTPPSSVGRWSTDNGVNYVSIEPVPATSVTNVRIEGSSVIADRGNVAPVPLPPVGSISGGSTGGDGWRVIPFNGKVFSFYHHRIDRPLYCADVATGVTCPGFPVNIPETSGADFSSASANGYFSTGGQFVEYLNRTTGELYILAQDNRAATLLKPVVVCANLLTGKSCGNYSFASAPDTLPNFAGALGSIDGGVVGTRLYGQMSDTSYACFDAATGTACAGAAANGTFSAGTGLPAGGQNYAESQGLQVGTRIYQYFGTGANRRVNCFDMATNTQCSGAFPLNAATFGPLFPTANASGTADGFCIAWDATLATTCYDLAGAPQTKPNLSATLQTRASEYNGSRGYAYGTALLDNGKTYWIADRNAPGDAAASQIIPSQKFCWDWSTNALCAAFINTTLTASTGGASDRFYELTSDPDRPNCLWSLGDAGQIRSFDARDGGSCGGRTTVQVPAKPAVAYCDNKPHTVTWNQVQLFGLTAGADFTAATLTIRDSAGSPVTGFNGISVSAFPVNIGSIPYSGTTTELTIFVELTGIPNPIPAAYNANPPPYLTATWTSDASQMCFDVKVLCAAPSPLTNTATGTIGTSAVNSTHSFTSINKAACATLSGNVYLDRNGSGTYNTGVSAVADDANITGVGLSLSCTNPNIGPVPATTTATGYSFTNVDPGASCTIAETQPVIYANGTENSGNIITIASVPAGVSTGNNFGEVAGSVSGKVFNQVTGVGIGGETINLTGSDAANTGLSGVTVTTAPVGGLPAGTLCPSQPALAAGEYYVCDVPLSNATGYTVVQPAQPTDTINGATTAGTAGGTASNPTATSSQVAGIVISGSVLAAPGNNFGEAVVAPTSTNDTGTTPAGITFNSPAGTSVLGNDTGTGIAITSLGGTPCTVPCTRAVTGGDLTVNADGTYTLVPTPGFSGVVTVPYIITDSATQTSTANIVITVTPTAALNAGSDVVDGATGTAGTTSVLANDVGTSLTVSAIGGCIVFPCTIPTSNGSVVVQSNGTYVFTATSVGTSAPITYTARDGAGQTVTSTLTLSSTAPGAPTSTNDTGTTPAGTTFNSPAGATVLGNDTGTGVAVTSLGGTPCSVPCSRLVTGGTLAVNVDGTYSLAPTPGFSGIVSVPYIITDSAGQTSTANIVITVTPTAAPNTGSDVVDGATGTPGAAGILANDVGTNLTVSAIGGCTAFPCTIATSNGSVVVQSNGTYVFTATSVGTSAPISYTARDSAGQTVTSTLTLSSTAPGAPLATPDTGLTPANTTFNSTATVIGNDTGTGIAITSLGGTVCTVPCTRAVTGGDLTVNAGGTYTLVPTPGFSGAVTVPYIITDSAGQTSTANIVITVTPTAAPNTGSDVVDGATGTPGAAGILANDVGINLTVSATGGCTTFPCTVPTSNGSVVVQSNGTYVFTATSVGTSAPISYTARDSSGQTVTSTLTLSSTAGGLPDLVTTVTLPTVAPAPGVSITATVTFGNVGAVNATSATVTLQIPPGATGVVPSNGGVYDPATGIVTWPVIASVPADTPNAGTFTVAFVPAPNTAVTVRSNASTPGGEASLDNNPSSATLLVAGPATAVPTLHGALLMLMALLLMGFASRARRNS
jgi:Bacterial Ig domain/Cadherin-like domain